MNTTKHQGFTLIELALVLSIIGLLLGSVLKGGEMVGRVYPKNLAKDFYNTRTQLYIYQDKFRRMAGDDAGAQQRINATNPGNGNGLIDGVWSDQIAQNSEAFNVWQHLRLANLAEGQTNVNAPSYAAKNAVGGLMGLQSGSVPTIQNLKGQVVMCSAGIAGDYVKQLDLIVDDGDTAQGIMMAAQNVSGLSAEPAIETNDINNSDYYVVCMTLI